MAFKMVLESHGAVLKAAAPKPRAAAPQQGVPLGVSQELRSRGGGAAVGGSGLWHRRGSGLWHRGRQCPVAYS